jgi:sec-independent protein translocase protein TatB
MGTPPPIMMANLGMADTLILMVLALVVFGPRRLPQIGRQIGKLMYEFRKASNDFKFQMEEELRQSEEADRRKKEEDDRQKALAAAPPAPQLEQTAASAVDSVAPVTQETPTESSYPGETSYPELGTEGTRTEEGAATPIESPRPAGEGTRPEDEAAQPESVMASTVETTRPRIQPPLRPPSTGEVVAANPPGRSPQQAELFESNAEPAAESAAEPDALPTGDAATAPESTTPDAANGTPNGANRSEPAAHHG